MQACTHCLLNTDDCSLEFDAQGVCNYCTEYKTRSVQLAHENNDGAKLQQILAALKIEKGEYQCLVGVSGGTDSSYLLYYLKQHGIKPLAVHCDNGWNTEKAVSNIKSLVRKLKLDLYTHVIQWEVMRDLQLAYLKSGVVDLELPSDHANRGALYYAAARHNIRYILTGNNFVTEGVMPVEWVYNKSDADNLRAIHARFGKLSNLHTYPLMTVRKKFLFFNIRKMQRIHLLNYMPYNKATATEMLIQEANWQPHPVKHGESVYTRFFQCHILPTRFGIDKRKAHLSNLICSGQITRNEALQEMTKPLYDPALLKEDRDFVLKKFELSESDFDQLMKQPITNHTDFRTDAGYRKIYNRVRQFAPFLKSNSRV